MLKRSLRKNWRNWKELRRKKVRRIRKKTQFKNLFPLACRWSSGLSAHGQYGCSCSLHVPFRHSSKRHRSRVHNSGSRRKKFVHEFRLLLLPLATSQSVDWGIGNVSQEGDYVYDSPHALGTERTGPDLAQIGGMRPTIWHQMHDRDPRSVSPGSYNAEFRILNQ